MNVSENDPLNLIITGVGRGFCAGADSTRLMSHALGEQLAETHGELIGPIGVEILNLAKLQKPTIAAINGIAAGGGLSMALACDIRIASERANFSAVWVRRGLVPDGGATYFMPRILGPSKALQLAYTGDMIDAPEALRIGLVDRVTPHNELMTVTEELASRIARGPSIAIELTKAAMYRSFYHGLESQLDFESYAQHICERTDDFKRGIEAFKEKRQPEFKGW